MSFAFPGVPSSPALPPMKLVAGQKARGVIVRLRVEELGVGLRLAPSPPLRRDAERRRAKRDHGQGSFAFPGVPLSPALPLMKLVAGQKLAGSSFACASRSFGLRLRLAPS